MPAHLSVATVIEKNRITSTEAFIVLLEVDVIDPATGGLVETLYMARNEEAVEYQGNLYVAANFNMEIKRESGEVPEIQLSAVDYSRALQMRMQNYRGGVGFQVRVMVINTANIEQPPEAMETFTITGASASSYVVKFTLGAENPLMQRFPMHNQYADKCRWRYKSEECGYTGWQKTCDLTLQGPNGCAAHGNTINYGGFPGLRGQ
jgi:phage-related protein